MADFAELIAISLDQSEWRQSLGSAADEYDAFIQKLNSKSLVIEPELEDTQLRQNIASINSQITSLADVFSSVFGTAADAASSATSEIKESFATVAEAGIASEKAQTNAVLEESKKRLDLRSAEAASTRAMMEEMNSVQRGSSSSVSVGGFGLAGSIADLAKFQLEWVAIQAVIEGISTIIQAPFAAIKDGVEWLGQFQEKASQLRANLLDSGIFSKNPAENLKLATQAADELEKKLFSISAQLGIAPDKIQASFQTLNAFGGSNLTHNLNDTAQLAGYATAGLQTLNPQLQQRQVATQLQKLLSGTLKDSDKLPAAFGLSAEQLNHMAEGARTTHDLLQQIIASAPGLVDRFGSADDRFGALVEKLQLFAQILEGTAATPLFNVLIAGMRSLDELLETNKGNIEAVAGSLGAMLGDVAKQFAAIGESAEGGLLHVIEGIAYSIGMAVANLRTLAGLVQSLDGSGNDKTPTLNDAVSGRTSWSKYWQGRKDSDFGFKPSVDAHEANKQNLGELHSDIYGPHQEAKQSDIPAYKSNPIRPGTGESVGTQTSRLREQYTQQIKDITSAGVEFRKQIDQDVKDGIATLQQATTEKSASFDSQAREIEEAGKRYVAAIRGIHGKGASDAQRKQDDLVRANDRKAFDDSINGKRADLTALQKLDQEIAEVRAKNDVDLDRAALQHSSTVTQQRAQRGIISPEQAATEQHQNTSLELSSQLDELHRQLSAIHGEDPESVKRRAELQGQVASVQQRSTFNDQDYQRQSRDFPFEQSQRAGSMQVAADQARTDQLEGRQRQHQVEGAQPDDIRSDTNQVLDSRLQTNSDETRRLSEALDHLVAAITAAPENASNPAAAVKASPEIQTMELKIASLAVDSATIKDLKAQIKNDAGWNHSANVLFGQTPGTDRSHFGSIQDSANSIRNATNAVGSGIQNVEAGYQQSGIGGAIGSGLSTVSQFLPGPIGSVVGAIGSLTSLFSGLFTQAAQDIGKEVAKAVDQIMEKYSTGQLTLNDTINQVQQQINSLISQESGHKGGQDVLDKELPGLQQELDSLKYQQQQTQWNFQDATVESSSTNQVTQQWLTDWININKQVQQYQQAVGSSGNAQITQYLNQELAQQQLNLENQYNQGQTTAINDALQLNQLLQQRNNYEDQYRQQQFQILSADSLQRRGNPAEQSARQLTQAKAQYDQQTQQLDFQIAQTQQKVNLETQIFGLAQDTATLQEQSLEAQNFQLQQQMAQYLAIVQLLQATAGMTASGASWNVPGLTTSSGGNFIIPGVNTSGAITTTDNSGQTVNINLSVPPGMDTSTLANEIAAEIQYQTRTRN